MELFKDPKVDWLGMSRILIAVSLALALLGAGSMLLRGGLRLGVDFVGGTLAYVKFKDDPELDRIRRTLSEGDLKAEEVTRFDELDKNEVQIRMGKIESEESEDLIAKSDRIIEALRREYDQEGLDSGKLDLNNVVATALSAKLQQLDPDGVGKEKSVQDAVVHYDQLAESVVSLRNSSGGVFQNLEELQGIDLSEATVNALRDNGYFGNFTVLSVESVGPKVGQEMRDRAQSAIVFSLLGILVYIAVRFQIVYGLAAIVALFHDVFITVGFLSLTNSEFTLTVVAALLTLVGYSINDTIVIFDRVRENLRLMRRATLTEVINASINQMLNRTLLTSGGTFLAVFALYLLGGPVLRNFSFALVIGILVGTYSSVAVASPIVVWWYGQAEQKRRRK
jgi:preprotein translocase subunit SecF